MQVRVQEGTLRFSMDVTPQSELSRASGSNSDVTKEHILRGKEEDLDKVVDKEQQGSLVSWGY